MAKRRVVTFSGKEVKKIRDILEDYEYYSSGFGSETEFLDCVEDMAGVLKSIVSGTGEVQHA